MKLFGIVLIVAATGIGYMTYRQGVLNILRLTRALAEDLAVLRCGICIHRRPLPVILSGELVQRAAGSAFWKPLALLMENGERSIRQCWEEAAGTLPEPLDRILAPLGALISTGGDTFSGAVNEVREELLLLSRRQQETQNVRLRLTAAMCFSTAALFILICI